MPAMTSLLRRASSLLIGESRSSAVQSGAEREDEVLYCKNNVCVHPRHDSTSDVTLTSSIHQPGYLTVTTKVFTDQHTNGERRTLLLTWIPNAALARCPVALHSGRLSKQQSVESLYNSGGSDYSTCSIGENPGSKWGRPRSIDLRLASTNPFLNPIDSGANSLSSSSEESYRVPSFRQTINIEIANPDVEMVTTPESEAATSLNSLSFLDDSANCSPVLPTKNGGHQYKCRRFSVDLSQMRSLRLFFNDDACTCGQLVVASRESQYKILHFHHGGLDHLAQILHQWHSLLHNIKDGNDDSLPFRHFMVCRPEVSDLELHPEENQVGKLTAETFRRLFNDDGQLEDDLTLRKLIFFSGMERDLRKEVWPFLLHVYPYQSTYVERCQIAEMRRQEYEEISRRRLELSGNLLQSFGRKVQSVVEKDVVRTDRANPFFSGDDNPNLVTMRNILLNYAVYNPSLGYTQGMSDLLAPVLCELGDEVATFWCFVGLMQRAVFVATPTDRDMDRSLRFLRELVRLMVPKFHEHLERHPDAAELLFCHRWILLCFKREFTEPVALRMWEACWANYLTDYFHLFLCLAIICVYADDVIAQDLRADEMLLHFSSLAMYMDGQVIARKARGLLHQFRQLREIPCTLAGLCTRCGPGIWDSSHSPRIYCIGHELQGHCNGCI